VTGQILLERLSYTHLELLMAIADPLKRAFYEIECIRGNWSVRTLKRQIATLYFERSGLSQDKEKLAAMVQQGVETTAPKLAIRDPYIFEFLGLRAKDAVTETDLEAALVENLRDFLLEMGHGFCLEAQQKSIVIGSTPPATLTGLIAKSVCAMMSLFSALIYALALATIMSVSAP